MYQLLRRVRFQWFLTPAGIPSYHQSPKKANRLLSQLDDKPDLLCVYFTTLGRDNFVDQRNKMTPPPSMGPD